MNLRKIINRVFGARLNCKPGDCAITTRRTQMFIQDGKEARWAVPAGTMVKVVRRLAEDPCYWLIEESIPYFILFTNGQWCTGTIFGLADKDLRPLWDGEPQVATPAWKVARAPRATPAEILRLPVREMTGGDR